MEKKAADLWLATQSAWDARDQERLSRLVGQDLMVEWRRRLADFERKGWHNRVQVSDAPSVKYVGLVNRDDDSEDRVTVHIKGAMTSYVQTSDGQKSCARGPAPTQVSITEYWTLARSKDGWMWSRSNRRLRATTTWMRRSSPRPGRPSASATKR